MQQEASLKSAYLRQVRKHLTCSPKERNRFLHRTDQMLDAFLEENPDATDEDLYLALGSPEELAEQMMEECQSDYSLSRHKNKLIPFSIVVSIALIYVCIVAFQYWKSGVHIEIKPVEYVYVTQQPTLFPDFETTILIKEG